MTEVCIAGSTGLVVRCPPNCPRFLTNENPYGSHILATLKGCRAITAVHAFTRKEPQPGPKVKYIADTNSTTWPANYPAGVPVFVSAIGTTARIAGSFAKQRQIDYDLNLALARAARDAGARIYAIISTPGASPTARMPYLKMKGELDVAVQGLGFEHVIVLRPGLLVGARRDSRPGEFVGRTVAALMGAVSGDRWKDPWAQDAEVVARAAVGAILEAGDGRSEEGVRLFGQSEIVRLGRTEWSGDSA